MKTYFKYIFLLLVLIVSSCKEEEQEKPKVNLVEPTVKPTDSEFECFGCGS